MQNPGHPALPDALRLMAAPLPVVADEAVRDALTRHYGASWLLRRLPGERDCNLLVEDPAGQLFVLKVFNAAEGPDARALQRSVLIHLERCPGPVVVPRLIPTRDGAEICSVDGETGPLEAILTSFVPGLPREERPATPALRRAVGSAVAGLGTRLRGFDHAGARRALTWDLMRLDDLAWIASSMTDRRRGDWLARFVERFAAEVRPRARGFRWGTIHNDLNGDNVLMAAEGEVVGIIDFGDVVRAPLVNDLAVAANHGLGDIDDLAEAVADAVDGFGAKGLMEDEAAGLYDLVLARLALRLLVYEWRATIFPANRRYILRNSARALGVFDRVMAQPPDQGRNRVFARWRAAGGAS